MPVIIIRNLHHSGMAYAAYNTCPSAVESNVDVGGLAADPLIKSRYFIH